MRRGVRWYLVSSLVLVALAGCGRTVLHYAQREPWRREAEAVCLRSGAVKENAGLVRIEPIEGPGICGAQFPLKVAALGESPAFGFADEPVRPPGAIASGPRWPVAAPRPQSAPPAEPHFVTSSAPPRAPSNVLAGPPLSLTPPGLETQISPPETFAPQRPPSYGTPPAYPQASPDYSHGPQPNMGVRNLAAPPDDRFTRDDRFTPAPQRVPDRAPGRFDPPSQQSLPALGPARPQRIGGATPVELKPTATLACPIVSALDQWIAASVQPAARHWFNQPVVEIKQISAYSCRGMNGQAGARISEHAFGNALDIAAFVFADGRRVTVKNGWQGSPEEQGFLRDVQGAACETFTTVLAPGSNRFHYDHIHVDLMRRSSGRRVCQPHAVDGEQIAARARGNSNLVASRREPMFAGRPDPRPPTRRSSESFDPRNDPFAYRRGDPTPTGSIAGKRKAVKPPEPDDDDDDWIEDDGPRMSVD